MTRWLVIMSFRSHFAIAHCFLVWLNGALKLGRRRAMKAANKTLVVNELRAGQATWALNPQNLEAGVD